MDPRIFENVAKIAANSTPPQPFVQQPYAFTELINVNWSTPVRLEDASNPESQLWTRTIKTYTDHPGTTNIWYGQMVDTPLIFKLIIDWVSPDDYRAFHESTASAELPQAWQSSPTPITTDSQQFFTFPMDQRSRLVAFQLPQNRLPDAVTVFVSAHFSPDWDPDAIEPLDRQPQRERKVVWDNAWMLLRDAALKSEGGYVSDKAIEGWSVAEMNGQKSHTSVIRFQDFRTASQFLKSAEDSTSAHASFDRLKQFAQGGVVAEVVTMKPLEPMAG